MDRSHRVIRISNHTTFPAKILRYSFLGIHIKSTRVFINLDWYQTNRIMSLIFI